MIALKSHLFTDTTVQSASLLPSEYGRSLRPNVMACDAFYCLTEIFNFAASSQMQFLNLIDVKLEKYTSLPSEQDFQSLPNLKYMKQMLDRYIQKTQRIIHSIKNAQQDKWPKDKSESGRRKAASASQNVEQDFAHLLDRAQILHRRTTEAISVLMSSISISESQRAIEQAERMGKLTFLAFVFVPLSFTTSFFAMNLSYIKWWLVVSVPVTGIAVALFFVNAMGPMKYVWEICKAQWAKFTAN
jgi:Mg2+ and Co2+ transporter CorA